MNYTGSEADVHEVFRKIANNERPHGSFLTKFAEAYIQADPENQAILRTSARVLILKYDLQGYAVEPKGVSDGQLLRGGTAEPPKRWGVTK